jgi:hypothetical protein
LSSELLARARAGLIEVLPDAPPVRVTRVGAALAALAVLAGTVVSLLRQPGYGALDTIWAEDGKIFLTGAVNQGFLGALTTSYNGYYHAIPRLVVELAMAFPAQDAAPVLALSAALITSLFAVLVYVVSGAHLESRLSRLLVSAVVVVLPVAQDEIPNSIANLHWAGLYVVFWLLIWAPKGKWARVLAVALVGLVAASDIIALVFLPLAFARWFWARRNRHSAWLLAVLSVSVALQISGLLVGSSSRAIHPNLFTAAYRYVLRAVPAGVLGQAWLGQTVHARWYAVAALAWLVVAGAAFLALRRVTRPDVTLAVVAALHSVGLYLLPVFLEGIATPRYAAAPAMLVLVCLVCLLRPRTSAAGGPTSKRAPQARPVVWPSLAFLTRIPAQVPLRILAVLMLVVFAVNLRQDNLRAQGPSWSGELNRVASVCGDHQASAVVTFPPGGPQWQSSLPCRYLRP